MPGISERPEATEMIRLLPSFVAALLPLFACAQPSQPTATTREAEILRAIFTEALARGQAFEHLRTLVTRYPGRLAGSPALADAVTWAGQTLTRLGVDRVYTQEVMVPHWERGPRETVTLLVEGQPTPLSALALGGSGPTPPGGLTAEVVEVKSAETITALGPTKLAGKIVFFNRPMDPAAIITGDAYGAAADQRSRGPALSGKQGAVAALVRSLTLAHDDHPHTGGTSYPSDQPKIPAAALSTIAADRLSAALATASTRGGSVRVALTINSRWLADAPSHNVIGEIRGTEFPDEIILVGGHLDSWDITPGAHDNGSGVVQSIEVLRLFRALGLQPRHTLRCVLFTNEENGVRGSRAYAAAVKEKKEKHLLAVETDKGGFQPHGFNFGDASGDFHERAAARWRGLFEPYEIFSFTKGPGGVDVGPLLAQGIPVVGLVPDSQRYFDFHHATIDSLDKVNPRELHLGAAALAALIWLVDRQGL